MWNEFKKFALKGNVVDMAVGVVVGSAFSGIVNSLVSDIIMPFFGFITAGIDFKSLSLQLSETSAITYGNFIQAIINFIIISFSIFMVVKVLNNFKKKEEAPAPAPKGPTTEELLSEIRDLLKESK